MLRKIDPPSSPCALKRKVPKKNMSTWEDNHDIKVFREYLRIPSVHPNIDYKPCVDFLRKQANNLDLDFNVYYPASKTKPVVLLTWLGQQPQLPAILLNSHMDVVPVFPEKWTHPPFAADIDQDGKIFARGTQDMKSVGIQYLSAIKAIKAKGMKLKRTVHLTYVPDEEIGGHLGMEAFVQTVDFKNLNICFALDEGIASESDIYSVFYNERSIWQIHFNISGNAGHGSLLIKNTVGEKLHYLLNKMMEFRQSESLRLQMNPDLTIGDVTTINLTRINGGIQSNVIPPHVEVVFDIRLSILVDHESFEKQLRTWCEEAGGNIELEFEQKESKVETKHLDNNVHWKAFRACLNELDLKMRAMVFPGGTDSRYIRQLGIPAIGFSPITCTPILLHDNDEFIKADTYLQGIEIYKHLIPAIANA